MIRCHRPEQEKELLLGEWRSAPSWLQPPGNSLLEVAPAPTPAHRAPAPGKAVGDRKPEPWHWGRNHLAGVARPPAHPEWCGTARRGAAEAAAASGRLFPEQLQGAGCCSACPTPRSSSSSRSCPTALYCSQQGVWGSNSRSRTPSSRGQPRAEVGALHAELGATQLKLLSWCSMAERRSKARAAVGGRGHRTALGRSHTGNSPGKSCALVRTWASGSRVQAAPIQAGRGWPHVEHCEGRGSCELDPVTWQTRFGTQAVLCSPLS